MNKGMIRASVRLLCACLLAVSAVTFGGTARAEGSWWTGGADWTYRKQVTIDTSPSGVNVSGPIGRSVVLVKLTSGNFTFTDALQNGADIRFVDSDDKTPLPFHIEKYDPQTGIAYIWVSIPTLNGGEKKTIYLYFANPNAGDGADAKGTFDADYMAVYHFGEKPGQPSADSTANANAAAGAPAGINEGSIIGSGARFPGQGWLTLNPSASLAMPAGSSFTFSAWIKPQQLAGDQALFARGPMIVGLNNGTPYVMVGAASVQASGAVRQGEWSHVAAVADGQTVKIYLNGIEAGAASGTLPALDGPITIGGAEGRPFNGEMDEARLSKAARPAAMLLAMASAEGPANKLVSVAETAEKAEGGANVIGFIVGKLHSVDAVIIVLCLLLLALAIWLMVAKTRYLNAATRANKQFAKRFAEMHEQLVPITEAQGVSAQEAAYLDRASPIARLYAIGIEELNVRRFGASAGRPLSAEAIEAMRAAVDAQFVEENQKLDRMMVILTIAISGGPFIGLLGTVIGVMTVFGGVAMAGDVNVNAIAPGIAAALLATIAGLACAIPSLFGYNYLNGRISALADQMRVFIDRLITRLAEMQADAAAPPPSLPLAAE